MLIFLHKTNAYFCIVFELKCTLSFFFHWSCVWILVFSFWVISVQTKMQVLYFQWQCVRASRANKVILFDINRASYCEQINHFNVCKHVRMASNIYSVLSELDKANKSFSLEKQLPRWLPGLPLIKSQSKSINKEPV